jgi:protein-S-isoprenylcysteine O-methyltransferase Ste14
MRGGPTAEKRPAQRLIMLATSLGFIALLVVSAFDHRFGWSAVPLGVVVAGDVLVAIGFGLIVWVYRENMFSSATIEVAENQTVVSTGPYAIVRHPMYAVIWPKRSRHPGLASRNPRTSLPGWPRRSTMPISAA